MKEKSTLKDVANNYLTHTFEHGSISNLIKIQEGRNTFIVSIKKTDYE